MADRAAVGRFYGPSGTMLSQSRLQNEGLSQVIFGDEALSMVGPQACFAEQSDGEFDRFAFAEAAQNDDANHEVLSLGGSSWAELERRRDVMSDALRDVMSDDQHALTVDEFLDSGQLIELGQLTHDTSAAAQAPCFPPDAPFRVSSNTADAALDVGLGSASDDLFDGDQRCVQRRDGSISSSSSSSKVVLSSVGQVQQLLLLDDSEPTAPAVPSFVNNCSVLSPSNSPAACFSRFARTATVNSIHSSDHGLASGLACDGCTDEQQLSRLWCDDLAEERALGMLGGGELGRHDTHDAHLLGHSKAPHLEQGNVNSLGQRHVPQGKETDSFSSCQGGIGSREDAPASLPAETADFNDSSLELVGFCGEGSFQGRGRLHEEEAEEEEEEEGRSLVNSRSSRSLVNSRSSREAHGSAGEDSAAPEPKQQRRGRDLSGRLAALVREVEEAERTRAKTKVERDPAASFSLLPQERRQQQLLRPDARAPISFDSASARQGSLPLGMGGGRTLQSLIAGTETGGSFGGRTWRNPVGSHSVGSHFFHEAAVPRMVLQPSDSACVAMRGVDRMRQQRLQALILALAQACAEKDKPQIATYLSRLDAEASPSGDPMQRCALHFRRALQARANATGAAAWREPLPHTLEELAVGMSGTVDIPSVSFGFEAMAGVLSSVLPGNDFIHVLGFGTFISPHWAEILKTLAFQPGGPPKRVRVTSVELLSLRWACLPDGAAKLGGHVLMKMAGALGIPFEFESIVVEVECFDPKLIRVEAGETLAVVCNGGLSLMPEESVLRSNPRSAFLKWAFNQRPAVFLLNEAHVNTTGPFFMSRVKDMLRSCFAFFESLDAVLPRDNPTRKLCEELPSKEILNCLACEGLERRVRFEVLELWQHRMRSVGFVPLPLGDETWERMRNVTEKKDGRWGVSEVDGAARLLWRGHPCIGVSAWF